MTSFFKNKIRPIGVTQLQVKCLENNVTRCSDFYLTNHSDIAVLSKSAFEKLKLVKRIHQVGKEEGSPKPMTRNDIFSEFQDVSLVLENIKKNMNLN